MSLCIVNFDDTTEEYITVSSIHSLIFSNLIWAPYSIYIEGVSSLFI